MPRWARFLSCSFTGLLLSLSGFLLAAYWLEGSDRYWQRLMDFVTTPPFWYLVSLFGLFAAVSLLLARVAVNLYGLSDGLAGFLSGLVVPLAYVTFLVSSNAQHWGSLAARWQRVWPEILLFAAPFALACAFTTWLWDRLD